MKNILIFAHVEKYTDNINSCKNFNQVQTYFVKKHLEKFGFDVSVVPGADWMGVKKQRKSTWEDFAKNVDITQLQKYDAVIFTGAIPTKKTSPKIMQWFQKNYPGTTAQFNEYAKTSSTDLLFFAMPGEETAQCKWVGPMYDQDSLFPEQQYENLIIHIDHHYPGRGDSSEQIKQLLRELPDNEFFQANWKNFEVYYHSKKLDNPLDFDFYNPPGNIPFKQLSSIYRSAHIGFLSHRETLGMYPVEISACGGIVAVLDKAHLAPALADLLPIERGIENFWNRVLPKLSVQQALQRSTAVQNFCYEQGVKKAVAYLIQN